MTSKSATLIASILLLLSLMACSSVVSPVDRLLGTVSDKSTLDSALTEILELTETAGMSVTVVKNGRQVYARGFGTGGPSQGEKVTNRDTFNLWSISKVFTQLTVLKLVEDGRLGLDDPICAHARWLDAQACADESNNEKVAGGGERTIRMLMNHSAGVPDIGLALYAETQFEGDAIPDQRELAKRLLPPMRKWSKPDSKSRYSNSHYLLLAAIVEQIVGQGFEPALQQQLLEPMGLTQTSYRHLPGTSFMAGSHNADLMSLLAFFYVDKGRAVYEKREGKFWFNKVYNAALGSTGLVSSSADMAQFMLATLACLRDEQGALGTHLCQPIIDSQELVVASSPARGLEGLTQKLGWFVLPTANGRSYSHGGSGMGYTSMLQLYPQQNLGVFVVANDSYFDKRGGLKVANLVAAVDW